MFEIVNFKNKNLHIKKIYIYIKQILFRYMCTIERKNQRKPLFVPMVYRLTKEHGDIN